MAVAARRTAGLRSSASSTSAAGAAASRCEGTRNDTTDAAMNARAQPTVTAVGPMT